jgi:protein-disulfide isomerase
VPDLRSAALPPLTPEDHLRGPTDGRLVILYADFSCPYCVLAHERLRDLPVQLCFRHFALRARPRALALALAAEAAGCQGHFWPMHDALFADPGHVDDPHLWERARALGLDVERFERDRRGEAVAERVRRDVQGGLRAGIGSTPTLCVEGRLHAGAPDRTLLAELAATPPGHGRAQDVR